jgi:hypothetical protein
VVVQWAAASSLGILNVQVQNIGTRAALGLAVAIWLSDADEDHLDSAVWSRLAVASANEPPHGRAAARELAPGQAGSIVGFVKGHATAGGPRLAVMYANWTYSDGDGAMYEGATNPVLVVEVDETTDVLQDIAPAAHGEL